jgi:TIR domain
MPKIAISYRRADSRAIVGRILDRLAEHYGEKEIFIDIENIPFGIDFRTHIDDVLHHVQVLIVIIGKQWRGPNNSGPARIFDEADPVRIELQTALNSPIRIIPILIDDATMPEAGELPDTLKEFSYRNALRLDSGVDFKIHIGRLISALEEIIGKPLRPAVKESDVFNTGSAAVPVTLLSPEIEPAQAVFGVALLVRYLILPVVLLALAHYLVVMKLNLSLFYLRLACILIPMACGFLLFSRDHGGLGLAVLAGAVTGVLAVTIMQTVVAMIDGTAILPSTLLEWQEAAEFLATIVLATAAGNLIARLLRSAAARGSWRTG